MDGPKNYIGNIVSDTWQIFLSQCHNRVGVIRLSQLLKGAVVVTLCQNEKDVKCQMNIDSSISLTEQAGKIRLIFPACSEDEIWGKSPLEIVLLPHFRRGLRQLLLSRTDTFDLKHLFEW